MATPLHLAVVGPLPPPAGGMANQTLQLVQLLEGEGIVVELVRSNAPYWPSWVGRIPVIRAGFRLLPYLWRLWKAAGRNHVFHVMANSGWSWHLFAMPAIWISHWRRVPVIVNYRGGEAAGFLARAGGLVSFSMRRAAALVVPSGFLREVFGRFGMQAAVIPNIIDLAKFHPGVPPSDPHIVVTRNLEPIYDVASAIRAMARLIESHPTARMSIAGSGPERAQLEHLADELGLDGHIRFTGRLDSVQMAELYRSASACLNTALVDNMPNSVLEALASGVPVVSTNVGGVPYIVKHEETALLVDAGDFQGMADAMSRLVADNQLRHRLIANGIKHVGAFAWDNVKQRWLAAYHQAGLAGRGSALQKANP